MKNISDFIVSWGHATLLLDERNVEVVALLVGFSISHINWGVDLGMPWRLVEAMSICVLLAEVFHDVVDYSSYVLPVIQNIVDLVRWTFELALVRIQGFYIMLVSKVACDSLNTAIRIEKVLRHHRLLFYFLLHQELLSSRVNRIVDARACCDGADLSRIDLLSEACTSKHVIKFALFNFGHNSDAE